MYANAQPRNVFQRIALATSLAAGSALTGCSADFSHVSAAPGPVTSGGLAKVGGSVFGGQQPVSGATVQLWVAGTTGYGNPTAYGVTPTNTATATPLGASVLTNSNGGFTLGSYTCPSNAYVYITAVGGDPQLTSGAQTNNAISLVTALGPCSALTTNTFIQINEVTTVAAVWALAPFIKVIPGVTLASSASSTTPSFVVSTSATNLQGLANAMSVANILANTGTGASPGTNTSGNVSNVEYWQVNTLANILAACVNSTGVSSSGCSTVVAGTTASGGTAPADTLQMAYYLASNPTKSTSLLGQVTATAPFQPYSATVNDWTIGYNIPTGSADSRWISFDQFGNAWVASGGTSIYELSPTGNILSSSTTYGLSGTSTPIAVAYQVAVDTANNAWFIDSTGHAIVEVPGSNAAGVAPTSTTNVGVSTAAVSTNAVDTMTIDGSNNVWASITSGKIVGLLSGAPTTLVTGATSSGSPFMMAADMSNITKFGNSTLSGGGSFLYSLNEAGCAGALTVGGATTTSAGSSINMTYTAPYTPAGGGTTVAAGAGTPLNFLGPTPCTTVQTNIPNTTTSIPTSAVARTFTSASYGIAFDNNNAMWVVNSNYTSTDTSSGHYSLSKMTPQNYGTDSTFTPAAAAPAMTFTAIAGSPAGLNAPFYLAMDGAGAAWVGNSAGAGLSAYTNAGVNISASSGFSGGSCTQSPCSASKRTYSAPRGVAVDGSGNVWVANTSGTYVTVVVGAAAPTVTPLALGIKNGTLASLP